MARQLLNAADTFQVREAELELSIPIDPDAVYTLRPITIEEAREIRKRHTSHVPNKRTHRRDEEVDDIAVTNDTLDYILVAWAGVTNGTGGLATCDLAHKLKLPGVVATALIEAAQAGARSPERRAESFREPA